MLLHLPVWNQGEHNKYGSIPTCLQRLCLEEVQGATTSSHNPPPILQYPWPRISCIRSYMLHASETWPLTKTNLQRLQCNDRAMIRQICSIKPEDVATVRSNKLLAKLELEDLCLILREKRLRWFWHVESSSGAVRTACDIQIDGRLRAGRPKLTWKKLTEKDCSQLKLTTVDLQERSTWRSGLRSAMHAASQLTGRGSTDVDDAPALAHESKIWLV